MWNICPVFAIHFGIILSEVSVIFWRFQMLLTLHASDSDLASCMVVTVQGISLSVHPSITFICCVKMPDILLLWDSQKSKKMISNCNVVFCYILVVFRWYKESWCWSHVSFSRCSWLHLSCSGSSNTSDMTLVESSDLSVLQQLLLITDYSNKMKTIKLCYSSCTCDVCMTWVFTSRVQNVNLAAKSKTDCLVI